MRGVVCTLPRTLLCLLPSIPLLSQRTILFWLPIHPGILVLLHLITDFSHPKDFNSLKALRYSGQLLPGDWLKTRWRQTGSECVCVYAHSRSLCKRGNSILSNALAVLSTIQRQLYLIAPHKGGSASTMWLYVCAKSRHICGIVCS